MTPASAPTAAGPSRLRRRLAQVAGGLVLGLVIAEGAFHVRDHGAFPHLNVYVPDAQLGVRLRPGASERISFAGNPVTSVRINRDGLRGAELPPPSDGEILVVGDSQVFGLGVEEGETASAELGRVLGAPVINAGVPTYGPAEYDAVIEEMLPRRHVRTVVYVVNLANDLFEAAHPNTERHAVWDGWAVRRESAPEKVTSFPGRELLMSRSHLVYALRSYLYRRGPALDERGFASEGTALDLVGAASRAGDEHTRAARETEAKRTEREVAIKDTAAKELAAEIALEDTAVDTLGLRGQEQGIVYQRSRDNPGDIVITYKVYAEESRDPWRTATILANGAEVRRRVEERIRAFASFVTVPGQDPSQIDMVKAAELTGNSPTALDEVRRGVAEGHRHPLVHTLEERDALKKQLDDLQKAPAEIIRAWSPLTPLLRRAKEACDAHGARLLVVALPMDLMVSPAEWAKYGAASPVDMGPTRILTEDVVASAEALGASALDATLPLAAAEPGAFLAGDIHMTPRGHRALAEAIAGKLRGLEAAR